MKTTIMVARGLVSITGLIQLALGIAFWSGHAKTLIPFHMITGLVLRSRPLDAGRTDRPRRRPDPAGRDNVYLGTRALPAPGTG